MIEALVVLMIAGTALLLVFEVGVDGARTGFRMGRRALAAADAEPGVGSLRTLIRGARFGDRLQPLAPAPSGGLRGFAAQASLDRAGLCGEAGPVGRVSVRLESTPEGDLLTCAPPGQPPKVLIDLRPTRARFSYSNDAAAWRATAASPRGAAPRRLYVRLTSDDGALDIVEESAAFPEPLKPVTPSPRPGAAL